jgi:hypothetical protein
MGILAGSALIGVVYLALLAFFTRLLRNSASRKQMCSHAVFFLRCSRSSRRGHPPCSFLRVVERELGGRR